jgi:hypothetical protein
MVSTPGAFIPALVLPSSPKKWSPWTQGKLSVPLTVVHVLPIDDGTRILSGPPAVVGVVPLGPATEECLIIDTWLDLQAPKSSTSFES